jgi:Protein of unknown function (DUF3800)
MVVGSRRVYLFADEAGNFDFSVTRGASRYFILGSVTVESPQIGADLLALRRELAWQGHGLDSAFHATEDKQVVRDRVFELIAAADLRVDATVLDKRKTQPQYADDPEAFYRLAWYLHLKYVAPRVTRRDDQLMVVAATLGTKKRRKAVRESLTEVVRQTTRCRCQLAQWSAESDPCLQVADYCTWAIQRAYERTDQRSYELVRDKIASEFEPFARSEKLFY